MSMCYVNLYVLFQNVYEVVASSVWIYSNKNKK